MKTTASTIAERFLSYLHEEGLSEQLPDIVRDLNREAERRQVITVVSAAALESKEQKELETSLFKEWGEHDITYSVDPSILSGLLISFGHRVIDMSGRNALTDLRQHLS